MKVEFPSVFAPPVSATENIMSNTRRVLWPKADILFVVFVLSFLLLYVTIFVDAGASNPGIDSECFYQRASSACTVQLWDSYRYLQEARGSTLAEYLNSRLVGIVSGTAVGGFSNSILIIQAKLAFLLVPSFPQIGIFLLNVPIYLSALHIFKSLALTLNIRLSWRAFYLFAFNPLILISTVSLTKEIWCVWASLLFISALVRKDIIVAIVTVIITTMIRDFLAVIFVVCALSYLFRIRPVFILVAISIVLPIALKSHLFTPHNLVRQEMMNWTALAGAKFMRILADIQALPLGHIVAAPAISIWNFGSPATLPFRSSLGGVYALCNISSSILFVALSVKSAWNIVRRAGRRSVGERYALDLIFIFCILLSLYPLSQHRYYLPIYAWLVLVALSREQGSDVAEPLAARRR